MNSIKASLREHKQSVCESVIALAVLLVIGQHAKP